MSNSFERFKAFYRTAPLWQGKLMDLRQFPLSNFSFASLDESAALELPNIPQGTVLGKRAEYYFKFCVEQSDNFELLVANLQVFKNKTTLGELDFILREKSSGQVYHVELVYKFYSYDSTVQPGDSDPVRSELSNYLGPNGRDHLLRKMDRLKEHQLPLLYHPITTKLLETKYGLNVSNIKQSVCFLGHVFIPRQLWNVSFPLINKNAISGYYMSYSAFAKAPSSQAYYLPHKHAWKMKPYALHEELTHHETQERVYQGLERGFASMVWLQWAPGKWERFFVVKDA
ncbi:DUF1853 family protein [Nonlabens xiamenensis]|uniref:DUF1853 family protein n=1 Tax=Nonlabens xiamenensis TaxID=2341043 RepID=UPI000F6119B0|nr:DUF1853 family protein [Nonlabens xiamenensis]